MAYINFAIPDKKGDLLSTSFDNNYSVKNVTGVKELPSELKNVRIALRDEGPEFILSAFDTYYSVLHHADSLSLDVIYKAFEDLTKATMELNKAIGFLLEDKDSINEEGRMKFLNVIKMNLYLYVHMVLLVEQRNLAKNEHVLKGRKKSNKNDDDFELDKKVPLMLLNNILQHEISIFWDPPVVEENIINLISGLCYDFLQNPSIKSEKEELTGIFSILGYLLKNYNHGTSFVVRITQLVKLHEHLVHCLPKGIQQVVQNFNCKGLLHELIEELTEWQTDEKYADNQGARYCAMVLTSLASLMPDLMLPEVMSLNSYLYHEAPSLRLAVLNVMVEVILNNLTGHNLSQEQKEFRDELLEILMQHIDDVTVTVRSKVLQQWARLQKESAIPLQFQLTLLSKILDHLFDKGALARKAAANCVTTFLSYNAYSANLSLSAIREELEKKEALFNDLKTKFKDPKMEKLLELQVQWNAKIDNLKAVVEKELEKGKENEPESQNNEIPLEQTAEIIRLYLSDDKFKEAFLLCKNAIKNTDFLKKFHESNDDSEDLNLFLTILHTVFFDLTTVMTQLENQQFFNVNQEDLEKYETLEREVEFLQHCEKFLNLIDNSIEKMMELLETTSVSDMHEAIEFFVTAYHFNIDRSSLGILAMLKIMQRNEQERKDAVVDAFKKIYLHTESSNMTEHCTTIVNRLIRLVKTVPITTIDDLQDIIANWCSKGILDNAVIDMLWQYFTLRVSVNDSDVCAVTELLRMAATGRKTIISRNINLVTNVAFGDRGKNNILLLGASCKLLAVAFEKVDINSSTPPFKISADDECFKQLINILVEQFFKPVKFYNKGLYGAIEFIYKMCAKPETVCEDLLNQIVSSLHNKQQDSADEVLPNYVWVRLCQMCGYIALKHLEFMDDTIYKELKRRHYVRDERKKGVDWKIDKDKKKKNTKRKSKANTASEASLLNSSMTVGEDMDLEGAQAEDLDAEYILNVLEKDIVCVGEGLGKLLPLIIDVCEKPDLYKGKELQGAAITALMRCMLVSSTFCDQHIRLVFTIFEKTVYPEVKTNILVHVSDLLVRFPNVIEPWTPRIFLSLNDPLISTRLATFFSLSSLILRDMIRAHSHIPEMAICLSDPDEQLKAMCKTFFVKLSHKENNLYNALPDIFSHLVNTNNVNDDNLQEIMKFLFNLIENTKHMENLVDRFCSKFKLTEEFQQHRNISYCLTLIKYNDKALKKLVDNFPTYRHLVHEEEIYANFRNVIQNCTKQQLGKADLKPIITELENLIKSVFELNEDGTMPPPMPPKSVKKPRKKPASIRKKKKTGDSDEEFDDSNVGTQDTPARKTRGKKN